MTRRPTATAESARLTTINSVAAVAFILGGSLFALGAVFAQLGEVALLTVNITYLVGGFFFSLGGYASVLLAVNGSVRRRRPHGRSDPVVGLPAAAARLAERRRAVRRDAAVRGQPRRGLRGGAHPPPVRRLDLVPGHPRLHLLPRLRAPRDARGRRGPRRGARPCARRGGWWRSTSSAPSCSSSPGSRPSSGRRPPPPSTPDSSTGAPSPAPSASRSAAAVQLFDKPTTTRTVVQHTP